MKIVIFFMLLFASMQSLEATTLDTSKKIEKISKKYLGDPYVWGGNTPETGMDCSGYTKYVFSKVGISIPRTAYTQSKVGQTIDMKNLEKGDLLFFLTDKKRNIPITHVGIYLGNDKFIHAASSKKGIIISSLSTGYYSKVFKGAKRVIKDDWSFKQSFYVALNEEAIKSSMEVKLTSFGGVNDTF